MTASTLSKSRVRSGEFSRRQSGRRSASPFQVSARILLVAALCGAPWAFGAVQPWAWASLTVLSIFTLALWAAGCAQVGTLKITWSAFYWPFLAFVLIACVQLLAGLTADRIATREAVLKLLTNFLIFFLAGQLLVPGEKSRVLNWFGLIVTLLAFGLTALALAQVMTSSHGLIYWSIPTSFGPYGPYVSYNDYCGLMEMLIPIAVGYILSGSSAKPVRMLLWLGVGIALASVWMSGSRAGTAVMLAEALVLGLIILRYWEPVAWRRALPLLAGLVLASAAVLALVGSDRVANRGWSVFQTDKSFEVKMGDRFWVARDTLEMARRHPVLGVGVGCFEAVFPSYASQPTDLRWTHAHDDIVEALAETGVVGGVVLLWGLVTFLRLAFRKLGKTLQTDWGWVRVGAVVGVLGLLAHSLVDFNLRIPANAAWFVVCLAIATQPYVLPNRPVMLIQESDWPRATGLVN